MKNNPDAAHNLQSTLIAISRLKIIEDVLELLGRLHKTWQQVIGILQLVGRLSETWCDYHFIRPLSFLCYDILTLLRPQTDGKFFSTIQGTFIIFSQT